MDEPKIVIVTQSETVYRARIAHSHTLKDGWRCSETTVEAIGSVIDYNDLKHHAEEAIKIGRAEAQERNRMDARLKGQGSDE